MKALNDKPLNDLEHTIRDFSRLRIARVFGLQVDTLRSEMSFGVDLKAKASFVSMFKRNEYDQLDVDIKDVASRQVLDEMACGALVIQTVNDYCNHMVRCYGDNPKEVARVIGLQKSDANPLP